MENFDLLYIIFFLSILFFFSVLCLVFVSRWAKTKIWTYNFGMNTERDALNWTHRIWTEKTKHDFIVFRFVEKFLINFFSHRRSKNGRNIGDKLVPYETKFQVSNVRHTFHRKVIPER